VIAPAELFALVAMIPALTNAPVPQSDAGTSSLIVALCGGGSVAIDLAGKGAPMRGTSPCCAKGCHASNRKRKVDPQQ